MIFGDIGGSECAEEHPVAKKSKKGNISWHESVIATHTTVEESATFREEEAIRHEGGKWINGATVVGKHGQYSMYFCGSRKLGCKVKLRVDVVDGTDALQQPTRTWTTQQDGEHHHNAPQKRGIHPVFAVKLDEHIKLGTTAAKPLLKALRACPAAVQSGLAFPQYEQINNYVNHRRKNLQDEGAKNTYAGLNNILGSLADTRVKGSPTCADTTVYSLTTAGLDIDNVPQVEYNFAMNEDGRAGGVEPYELPLVDIVKKEICIVFTSKAMLRNLVNTKATHFGGSVSIDGKYKVMWNGFPVIPLGAIDADGHLHYVAMAIFSSETTKFYGIFLHAVFVAAMHAFPEFDGTVAYGMSDNSDIIGNAAFDMGSLTLWKWLNCYMHLQVCNIAKKGTNLNKRLDSDAQAKWVQSFCRRIRYCDNALVVHELFLHLLDYLVCNNVEFGKHLVTVYLPQYTEQFNKTLEHRGVEVEVLPSTRDERFDWKGRWSSAEAKAGVPMAQTAIEGKNPGLAIGSTGGRREVVTSYVPSLVQYMQNEGADMVQQDGKRFSATPTVRNNEWREGQLMRENLQIHAAFVQHEAHGAGILLPSKKYVQRVVQKAGIDMTDIGEKATVKTKMQSAAEAYVRFVRNPEQEDLETEQIMKLLDKFYFLKKLETPLNEYILYSCTCPKYVLHAVCKHALAVAICKKEVVVPADKNFSSIGRKKKPGRPKKATPAWDFQSDSDSE